MDNKKNIFIVEDEAIAVVWLELMLKNAGFVISGSAASGEDAVEMVRELSPDIVLMDIRLTGELDGIEAAEQIQKIRKTSIIYITGYSEKEMRTRAMQSGCVAYLVKPIQIDELVSVLHSIN